jgi:hypothetical protein
MTCNDVLDMAPAYVLGALDRIEEDAVREHLETCPDAHAELAELGVGVAVLAESVPLVEPPAALKGRIMAAAKRDLEERMAAGSLVASRQDPVQAEQSEPVRAAPRRSVRPRAETGERGGLGAFLASLFRGSPAGLAMRGVAVVAIVALAGWNLTLQSELGRTRSYQVRVDEVLTLARLPGAQLALLTPAGSAGATGPSGVAVMPPSGTGRLVMSGLRPTTGTQVYEAWAILEGQAPIPVGGFTVGADGVGYFDAMPAAGPDSVVVAITLEPGPNATAPTTDPVSVGVSAPVAVPSTA